MLVSLKALRKHPVVDLVLTLVVAVAIAYGVQAWIVKPYRIPSESMVDTFRIGDRVLAARFLYRFKDPERGDVIVFHPNGKGSDAFLTDSVADVVFVKRLIGMPGEWVQAEDGHVQICKGPNGNGCRTLDEPYVSSAQENFGPFKIPAGKYWMMGDNRAASDDSRVWGTITKDQMIGRAFMIYWPPTRLGFF
jgi:signal peptidase I